MREYAGIHGFIPIVDDAVPLDTSNHNLSIGDAVRLGFCGRDLQDSKTAHWALMAASDHRYMLVVNRYGVIHDAREKLLIVFLPQLSSRTQTLQESII